MFRQLRHNTLCYGLHFIVGLCTQQITENSRYLVQSCTRFFQSHNGVVETRRFRVVDDSLYFLIMFLHTLFDGRLIMLGFNQMKRCCLMGCIVCSKKRVLYFCHNFKSLSCKFAKKKGLRQMFGQLIECRYVYLFSFQLD